jgi:type IV secretory pathway VirJ component
MTGPALATLLAAAAAASAAAAATAPPATLPGGRFGPAAVVVPPGPPRRVVLFLSGDGGWEQGVRDMASALARDGALVLGLSTPRWARAVRGDRCAYPAGELESIAQAAEKRLGLPVYLRPVLVGYSSGATLAYAALAQAPAGTFAGAVSLGFCPDLDLPVPFCAGSDLARVRTPSGRGELLSPRPLAAPWVLLTGRADEACPLEAARAFARGVPSARVLDLSGVGHGFGRRARFLPRLLAEVAALDRPARPPAPAAMTPVDDLPLVEVAATGPARGVLAVLVTGDGGWAGIDREIAAALAAEGFPVVGLDSLRYFWTRRTPASFAADLARVVEHHAVAVGAGQAVLVGYSRGADVLPAAVGLLPEATRRRVRALALVGPGRAAGFELHVTDFLGGGEGGRPTLPDVLALGGLPVLCLSGSDEAGQSLCPLLAGRPGVRLVELPGGHHFGGDYARVAREVAAVAR